MARAAHDPGIPPMRSASLIAWLLITTVTACSTPNPLQFSIELRPDPDVSVEKPRKVGLSYLASLPSAYYQGEPLYISACAVEES